MINHRKSGKKVLLHNKSPPTVLPRNPALRRNLPRLSRAVSASNCGHFFLMMLPIIFLQCSSLIVTFTQLIPLSLTVVSATRHDIRNTEDDIVSKRKNSNNTLRHLEEDTRLIVPPPFPALLQTKNNSTSTRFLAPRRLDTAAAEAPKSRKGVELPIKFWDTTMPFIMDLPKPLLVERKDFKPLLMDDKKFQDELLKLLADKIFTGYEIPEYSTFMFVYDVQVSKSNGATADEKVKVEWTIMFREMTQQFARIVELMVNRQMLIQITNTVKDKLVADVVSPKAFTAFDTVLPNDVTAQMVYAGETFINFNTIQKKYTGNFCRGMEYFEPDSIPKWVGTKEAPSNLTTVEIDTVKNMKCVDLLPTLSFGPPEIGSGEGTESQINNYNWNKLLADDFTNACVLMQTDFSIKLRDAGVKMANDDAAGSLFTYALKEVLAGGGCCGDPTSDKAKEDRKVGLTICDKIPPKKEDTDVANLNNRKREQAALWFGRFTLMDLIMGVMGINAFLCVCGGSYMYCSKRSDKKAKRRVSDWDPPPGPRRPPPKMSVASASTTRSSTSSADSADSGRSSASSIDFFGGNDKKNAKAMNNNKDARRAR